MEECEILADQETRRSLLADQETRLTGDDGYGPAVHAGRNAWPLAAAVTITIARTPAAAVAGCGGCATFARTGGPGDGGCDPVVRGRPPRMAAGFFHFGAPAAPWCP